MLCILEIRRLFYRLRCDSFIILNIINQTDFLSETPIKFIIQRLEILDKPQHQHINRKCRQIYTGSRFCKMQSVHPSRVEACQLDTDIDKKKKLLT